MPDPNQVATLLQVSVGSVDRAIALAEARRAELDGHLQAAQTSRAAIEAARVNLQNANPADPANLAQVATAGVQAAADGLRDAGNLVNATVLAALNGNALDEWKECRNTIDRCDKLLVDIRKTGFGFITAVVGAAAYVFARGDHVSGLLKSYLLCSLVVLIIVLYLIDLAHQSWLLQAVGRARALEETPLNFHLTRNISRDYAASQAVALASSLYFLLLLSSCVIFWASIPLSSEDWYSAPRANIYAAFAVGLYTIITAPLVSGRKWWWLLAPTGLYLIVAVLLIRFGLMRVPDPIFHAISRLF